MAHVLKFSQFINESDEQKEITKVYDKAGENLEKVIMKLSGNQSGEITKLVNRFVETYELLKEAQESHESIKKVLKDKLNKSFDDEERFVTRIIETVKYALTFSKYTRKKEDKVAVVNYEAAIDEMIKIFPDIEKGLKAIIEKHTDIKTIVKEETSGAIKYSHIKMNEGITDVLKGFIKKLETVFSSLHRTLSPLVGKIDTRLAKIDGILKG